MSLATPRRIALLASSGFASAANIRVGDALLPDIAREYGTTVGRVATILAFFTLAYGIAQIVLGPLGDRLGKFRVISWACLGAGLASLGVAIASDLTSLGLVRLIAGALAGATIPLAIAWIGDQVPYEQRQPVIAKFLTGQILGILSGQAAGGLLADALGWRATLLTVATIHIAAGIGLIAEFKSTPALDQRGTGKLQPLALAHDIAQLWRSRWVQTVVGSVALEGFAIFGALAYVGADLRIRFGASAGTSGLLLATFGIGAMAYVFRTQWLITKFGQIGLAVWGGVLLAISYGGLALLPSLWLAPLPMMLMGLGFYMLHNTLQTNASQMAPDARGLAVSQFAFCLFLGQTIGITLAGLVVDRVGARPLYVVAALILLGTGLNFGRALKSRAKPTA
jgi:MFS transporter, YNFM family, putative membrane transport protein